MRLSGCSLIAAVLFTGAACADTLTLPQAQLLLFNNNRDVQIAEAQFLKSLVEVSEAKASYYPTAETYASYMYQSKPNYMSVDAEVSGLSNLMRDILPPEVVINDEPLQLSLDRPVGDHDRFEWGTDITFPVFTGLSRRYSVRAAEAASTVKCLGLTTTKDRLSLQLGLLYFFWELSERNLETQQVYINQISEHLVQMQNLFQGGVESRTKVLQAQARLEAAKVDLLAAQSTVDSLHLELIDFLRLEDDRIVPRPYDFRLPEHVVNSTPRTHRNEVIAIDSTISSLRNTEWALKGHRFPSLVAMAGYRVGNPGIVMGGDEFIDWGVAGLQLRWTIYDGQKNWARREALRHDVTILKREREKQIAMWEKTAAQQRAQIQKAHRMKAAAELSFQAAQALAADLENSLSAGVVSSADYLDALSAVAQAQFRVAQAETRCKTAQLQLAYALGENMDFSKIGK